MTTKQIFKHNNPITKIRYVYIGLMVFTLIIYSQNLSKFPSLKTILMVVFSINLVLLLLFFIKPFNMKRSLMIDDEYVYYNYRFKSYVIPLSTIKNCTIVGNELTIFVDNGNDLSGWNDLIIIELHQFKDLIEFKEIVLGRQISKTTLTNKYIEPESFNINQLTKYTFKDSHRFVKLILRVALVFYTIKFIFITDKSNLEWIDDAWLVIFFFVSSLITKYAKYYNTKKVLYTGRDYFIYDTGYKMLKIFYEDVAYVHWSTQQSHTNRYKTCPVLLIVGTFYNIDRDVLISEQIVIRSDEFLELEHFYGKLIDACHL